MTIISKLNNLAILNSGRNPQWAAQPTVSAPNGPPSSLTDGVDLQGAVVALAGLQLNADPSAPSSYITLTYDAATTYTVTVDSTGYSAAANTDAATTLADLAAVLVTAGITAEVVGSELVVSTSDTVTVSASGGTGTISIDATDATSVDFAVWLLSGGTWFEVNDSTLTGQATNWLERAEVAGCSRCYIEITATDGRVTPRVGPCLVEV